METNISLLKTEIQVPLNTSKQDFNDSDSVSKISEHFTELFQLSEPQEVKISVDIVPDLNETEKTEESIEENTATECKQQNSHNNEDIHMEVDVTNSQETGVHSIDSIVRIATHYLEVSLLLYLKKFIIILVLFRPK